jgi:hypothetical protein
MPSIHVNVPSAISAFDYGLNLIGAAIGRYASLRLDVQPSGFEGSTAALRGARAVFQAAGTAPSGLRLTSEYDAPPTAAAAPTLAVAGAAAANVLIGTPYTREEVFEALVEAGFKPHLAAAALFGGFQVAVGARTTPFDAPIDELGVLRVAGANAVPIPSAREAAGAALSITLGLAQGSIPPPPPVTADPPGWYAALLDCAATHKLIHLSPSGTAAIALDGEHLTGKLERIAEAYRQQTRQTLEVAVYSINRQGVSISEYGRFEHAKPIPYRGGDDD